MLLCERLDRGNVDEVEPADDLACTGLIELSAAARTSCGAVIDDFVWTVAGGSEMRLMTWFSPTRLSIGALGHLASHYINRIGTSRDTAVGLEIMDDIDEDNPD